MELQQAERKEMSCLQDEKKDKQNEEYGKHKKERFMLKQKRMSVPCAIAFFLVAAVIFVHFQTIVTNSSLYIEKSALSIEWKPIILLYNALPLFLMFCTFYFISGSVSTAFSIVSIVFTIMLTVNFFKVEFRAEPFIPTDIATVGEAANMTTIIKLKFSWIITAAILFVLASNILMWLFVRSEKIKVSGRIAGALSCVLICAASYFGIYTDTDSFKNLPSFANVWKDISVMQNKGFLYMFLTRFELFNYDAPDGYSREAAFDIYESYNNHEVLPEGYVMPDVIAIMGESYFDIKRSNLEYADGFNPTKNLERLRSEGAYGNLIVRGIGGGTVISEFEFLTSNVMPFITDTIISPYNTYISREAYSIPVYLKNQFGYYNIAMHLGNEWFYNRRSTYPRIGFDDTLFYEDIEGERPKKAYNGYTEDSELADRIIEKYDEHLKTNPQQGYFNFNVTVENHLPYNEYDAEEQYIVKPENMEDSAYFAVNQYAQLLARTDEVAGRVADYLENSTKPAIIVFYGDHLPNFNQKTNDILPQMGIDVSKVGYEGDLLTHSTPYVIWGNKAFKEQAQRYNITVPKGEQETISSNYLGIKMLEYMNCPLSSHYSFVKEAEKEIPVITPYYYVTKDNRQTVDLNEEQKELIDKYKIIQYYALLKYNKK